MKYDFPQMIAITRKYLLEDGKTFGARFGVGATAVSLWESGKREAPYKVIDFCFSENVKICDKCNGKGYIN